MSRRPPDLAGLRDALARSRALRQWSTVVAGRAAEVRRASRGLRQHARALHACYQYWRQRYLLVECTWCQKHLGWQYMDKPLVDLPPTSHGVCPTCFETQWREQRRRQP